MRAARRPGSASRRVQASQQPSTMASKSANSRCERKRLRRESQTRSAAGRAGTRHECRGPSVPPWPRRGTRAAPRRRDEPGRWRSGSRRDPLFEALLRRLVGLRVTGPGLLPGQTKRADQPQHPARATGHAQALLGQAAQVHDAPGRNSVPLRIGPRRIIARSAACLPSSMPTGRPGRGWSRRPATPSALKRITQSRSVWRSMPAARAAAARLRPSSTPAIASSRAATRPSRSRLAQGAAVLPLRCRRAPPVPHPSHSPNPDRRKRITPSPKHRITRKPEPHETGIIHWMRSPSSASCRRPV